MIARVVDQTVFIPSPKPGVGVFAASYYGSASSRELLGLHWLISRSDTADVAYLRRSTDGGRTWDAAQEWPTRYDDPRGTRRRHPRGGYFDARSGRYLSIWTEGVLPHDEPLEGMRHWTLWYAVSDDGGRSDAVRSQIIHAGTGYDATHHMPGITEGRNCLMIGDLGCRPLTLTDGTILVPAQSSPTGPDGNYFSPGGGFTYTDAVVLSGRWQADGSLAWRISARVAGEPNRTTRGLIEPTLAQLPDGRILMVMRGSNDRKPELPAHKWFALSCDQGLTWTTPAPWGYTDGALFHSPSACSQLVPHSSGRIFWVGNICAGNANGNSPRYPIVLAEVDAASGLLRRDTLSVLDDRKPGESQHLTLSNFFVREDLDSQELLLHMTRFFAREHVGNAQRDWTADALLYRIALR